MSTDGEWEVFTPSKHVCNKPYSANAEGDIWKCLICNKRYRSMGYYANVSGEYYSYHCWLEVSIYEDRLRENEEHKIKRDNSHPLRRLFMSKQKHYL